MSSEDKNQSDISQALVTALKNIHGEAEELVKTLQFNKKKPKDAYLIGSYLSLLELTDSFISLIGIKKFILSPAILRCVLETYVDFENILRDEKYTEQMEVDNKTYTLKKLYSAKKGVNPYLENISLIPDIDDVIKELEKKVGGKKRSLIKERFERAGLENEYEGLYSFLSGNTHSSINALYYRHFEREGNGFAIVYGKELSPEQLVPYLDSTAGCLLDAAKKVNALYGDNSIDRFKPLEEELNSIRKRY
jgi:hypothetical protein